MQLEAQTNEERSFTFYDKSQWGDGEWQHEADKLQWVDKDTGLDCLIVRTSLGHLCGYVGIPEKHRLFGVDYDQANRPDGESIQVHGGLTFASLCHEGEGERRVCHTPFAGRPDRVWWLGFDCAHSGDVSPASDSRLPNYRRSPAGWEKYRTVEYVRQQCRELASQLVEI